VSQVPSQFVRRAQSGQRLASGPLVVESFGLQRRDRVLQVVGQLGAHLDDIGCRETQFAAHSIQIGGDGITGA
jgi:hypothetical protein